jgi:hypothetical protein
MVERVSALPNKVAATCAIRIKNLGYHGVRAVIGPRRPAGSGLFVIAGEAGDAFPAAAGDS